MYVTVNSSCLSRRRNAAQHTPAHRDTQRHIQNASHQRYVVSHAIPGAGSRRALQRSQGKELRSETSASWLPCFSPLFAVGRTGQENLSLRALWNIQCFENIPRLGQAVIQVLVLVNLVNFRNRFSFHHGVGCSGQHQPGWSSSVLLDVIGVCGYEQQCHGVTTTATSPPQAL